MALSVKRFEHPLGCPEPSNYVTVNYHATSADELCAGNGTLYQIWGDYSALTDIFGNQEQVTGSDTEICNNGMDVVFLVDYTGSMGDEINNVKTGISDIVQTINVASSGDYRLGLVIFDEYSTSATINYQNTPTYTNLPNAQKIDTTQNNTRTVITCLEKMSSVGNSTSFETELNKLNTTNLPLGNGHGFPEPSGIAGNEVVGGFAGGWRSDVMKLVILITDAPAGGDDDFANSTDDTFFANTLIPNADNANVQFLIQTNYASEPNYTDLANNTTPQGLIDTSVNFNDTNWPSNTLIPYIEQLCDETFLYNCDPAPVGWYMEPGETTAYYWDGTSWTQQHDCEYTVKLNLAAGPSFSNMNITSIPSSHQYYFDADTFAITGTTGTPYSITWTVYPDTYYSLNDITGVGVDGSYELTAYPDTFTDSGQATTGGEDTGLAANEFKISGAIGSADSEHTITLVAGATAIEYRQTVTIQSNVYDTGGLVDGEMTFASSQSGWTEQTYFNTTHNVNLKQFTKDFVGVYNSVQNWGTVAFLPDPGTYDLVLAESYGESYSNSGTQTAHQNGTVTYNSVGETMSGQFNMPALTGTAVYVISGESNQPQYTTTLDVTEFITGSYFNASYDQVSYTGYEGQSTTIEIPFLLEADYNDVSINTESGVIVTGTTANSLVTNVSFNTTTNTLSFDLAIGSSNVTGNMEISGTANEIRWPYEVTFVTSGLGTATIATYTYNAFAGADGGQITRSLQNMDNDYTYNITGSTHTEEPSNGSFDVISASGHDVVIDLPIMPSGGGSATVTVTGTLSENSYDFDMLFLDGDGNYSWQTNTITYTGTAGSTIAVSNTLNANTDYEFVGDVPITIGGPDSDRISNSSATIENSGTYDDEIAFGATLTMPSGGGEADVTLSPTTREITYTYTLTFQTNQGATGVTHIESEASGVTTTNNGNGTFTAVFSGQAGDVINGPKFAVNANNTTDYDAEIAAFSYSSGVSSVFTATEVAAFGGHDDAFTTQLTMPSGGGSGTVTASTSYSAITHSFVLTSSSNITGVSIPSEDRTVTYYGTVGASITMNTVNPTLNSGYDSYDITSVTNQGSYVSAQINSSPLGEVVDGTITMPSGGGSQTIYLNGTSIVTPTTQATTTTPVRTLTVNYIDNATGAFVATEGNQSSGGGGGISQQSFTGLVGSTGTEWNAIIAESGYENPIVTSVDTSSSSYISSGAGAGENNATYADWKFNWTIPSVDTTVNLTVNGGAQVICTCDINASASSPSSYGGSDGRIDIIVQDSCVPQYSWTLNGSAVSPTSTGPLQYAITGLSAGLYTIVLTDGQGCQSSVTVGISDPATTQATSSYYYYTAFGCDTDAQYTLRATSQFPIAAVRTNKFGEDEHMCLFRETLGPAFDYTIIGPGSCDTCIDAEP